MKRTLGLDLGTNSIGWAIITEENGKKRITAHDPETHEGYNPVLAGSVIFSEGVARVKGNEVPSVSTRTSARRTRRLYMRRRMRKQRLLQHLIKNGLCPLSEAGLRDWKEKGNYPTEDAFTAWFIMNPYELRAKGLNEKLTQLELGRILYHIAQRRGFRSNRKGGDGEQKTLHEGSPDRGITGYNETKKLIERYETLGKAGAELHKTHTPIRNRYVMRVDLVDEFNKFWEVQKDFHPILSDALKAELGDGKNGDLFFQRELKGKKGDVGRCTLEPGNKRAPLSSPIAEVFNVLHAVNNIKMDKHMLSEAGREAVLPLFFKKDSKGNVTFTIEHVRKALKKAGIEGELNYEKWESRAAKESKEVKLTGAKTIAHLADLWNTDAMDIFRAYAQMRKEDEAERQKWDDRWNTIHREQNAWGEISERKEKGQYVRKPESKHEQRDLKEYATNAPDWKFNDDQLKALKAFDPKQGYHNLSARAMGRTLPYLYQGVPYHDAVLFANLPAVFKVVHWQRDANGMPILNAQNQPIAVVVKDERGKKVPKVDDRWSAMNEDERESIRNGIRDQVKSQRVYSIETILLNGLIRNYRDQFGDAGRRNQFWNGEWDNRLDRSVDEAFSTSQKREMGDEGRTQLRSKVKAAFLHHIESHDKVLFEKVSSMEDRIKFWLIDNYPEYELAKTVDKRGLTRRVDQLYHHSAINTYRERDDRLGNPVTRGMKNPMVYRALHTLRKLVNEMLPEHGKPESGLINKKTEVHIEMARQLDSANKRRAWERYQAVMRTKNEEAADKVREYFKKEGREREPSDDEIERMWLLEEARDLFKQAKCVYTGKIIGCADLFNGGAEVEHTLPRSKTADNSMANKMLCDTRYNRDVKKGHLPGALPNFEKPFHAAGHDCPAISDSTKPIYARYMRYKNEVETLRDKSKAAGNAGNKDKKDKAIQDRWYAQFFRDYWRTKYEHLMAEEIKPRFLNRQLVATAQITKLARRYMNSYFDKVVCYKPEALSAFRKEWMGESFVKEKDRSKHSHHALDAAVCAAVDWNAFTALAHHYEVHDEKDVAGSFDHPWDNFGTDMHKLRDGALIHHVDKASIGRSSNFKKKVKLKDGTTREVYATGDSVRGSLHNDTYYGRIKRQIKGTEDFETVTVIRKSLLGTTQFPFKEADKANVVDKKIKELLADKNLEKIKAEGGLEMKTKNGDSFTVQKLKKVRVLEKRIKNPVAIKMHRDTIRTSSRHKAHEPLEHKQHLWVTGGENPVMAIYADAKGRINGYVFGLLELTRYMQGRSGRNALAGSIPRVHPDPKRVGYTLAERKGKPFLLHAGQKLVLYKQSPEEVDRSNPTEMNKRTYVIRELIEDGRIRMHNVLDAREDAVIKEQTLTEWDPERSVIQLRISVSKLNALCDGIDIELSPLPMA
ncbi:MAG: hypothetical protein IPH60_10860 [Flavobacteriales bacterium]|jgi:CRISPR-associated endonuclease Csn1|nr:hypothetical protein [Flavobacteriales bacterium]MBP9160097.1 hypothetical protein [Flavobacteriales bacterium]HQV76529.1 HNH endonuclease domain-containing protein [Flavobacteriales bacterium]HQW41909.1 HNH endonuclease domain-containing protein [Flavobacteriales bacterium]